jgi:hypothetical protein
MGAEIQQIYINGKKNCFSHKVTSLPAYTSRRNSSSNPRSTPLWIVPKKPDSQGSDRWILVDWRKFFSVCTESACPLQAHPSVSRNILDSIRSATNNTRYYTLMKLVSKKRQTKIKMNSYIVTRSDLCNPNISGRTELVIPSNFRRRATTLGIKELDKESLGK